MDDKEFNRVCLQGGRLLPLATITERRRHAADFRRLSELQLKAAELLLDTAAEEMVVGHAYRAMEAKANELLALSGYRSKSHVCTQAALARLLGEADLARTLSRVYPDRQVFDYTTDPGTMRSAKSFRDLVRLAASYLEQIGDLLENRDARDGGGSPG